MKNILLMRHAKSDWANSELTDHQRPLNERGKRDAPIMAQEILSNGIIPEVMLVSDAKRTRETWELMKNKFPNAQTIFLPELYLASADVIVNIIRGLDDLIDSVLVLAHNPGITSAFEMISEVSIDNVPTAGVGCFNVKIEKFKELGTIKGTLNYFVYPKMLKG